MKKAFSKNLRALRKREHLSQAKLAEKIGATTLTVLQYEQARKFPSRNEIRDNLIKVLNCTEQDLYGFSDGYYAKSIQQNVTGKAREKALSNIVDNELAIDRSTYRVVDNHILEKYPRGIMVQITDDSMDKLIPKYSYCYISTGKDVNKMDNKVCAYTDNGFDISIRRVNLLSVDNLVALIPQSSNVKYQTITLDTSKNEDFEIFGKVVWFSKDCEDL